MFETEQKLIETRIKAYAAQSGLPEPDVQWKWIPFSGEWGISTSFFSLAALEARLSGVKTNVQQRAQDIAQVMADHIGDLPGFERVEAVRGYLNLYFDPHEYARRVVDTVLEQADCFGTTPARGEQVMVEYSQPNTHKAFHVGHLRSAILGESLARILSAAGYDVIRANYPGDMGLHVIKWLWNYMKFHAGEKPDSNITAWMGKLYAEASRRIEENPEYEAEVRALYVRWDQRDPEIVKLWEETREWSLQGFREMYDRLGIHFDRYYFNSMAEQPGKELVADLIARGIAQDERPEGAVIVKLDELLGNKDEKYRVMVVLRSDGTALYSTEDLALAAIKFQDYPNLTRSLYVVDVRQSLHFTQVFKTLEVAGYPFASRCEHVPYELVSLPGNVVMASREGTVVLLEDLLQEARTRALAVVEEKNPDLTTEQKLAVAEAVGVGAVKYPMLARDNTKIVTFDWQTALDFNGQASPYIQYAGVRANSILRKAGGVLPESRPLEYDLNASEKQLIDLLSRYPGEVVRAANEMKPLLIASMAYDLAKSFTEFYNASPVVQADAPVREFRLRLVMATRQVVKNSLALLGITAPEAM